MVANLRVLFERQKLKRFYSKIKKLKTNNLLFEITFF